MQDHRADLVQVDEVRPAFFREVRQLGVLVQLRERKHGEALGHIHAQMAHWHVDLRVRRLLAAEDLRAGLEEQAAVVVQHQVQRVVARDGPEGRAHGRPSLGLLDAGGHAGAERVVPVEDLLLPVLAELRLDLVDHVLPDQLGVARGLRTDALHLLLQELSGVLLLLFALLLALDLLHVDQPRLRPAAADVDAQQAHGEVLDGVLRVDHLLGVGEQGLPALVHDAARQSAHDEGEGLLVGGGDQVLRHLDGALPPPRRRPVVGVQVKRPVRAFAQLDLDPVLVLRVEGLPDARHRDVLVSALDVGEVVHRLDLCEIRGAVENLQLPGIDDEVLQLDGAGAGPPFHADVLLQNDRLLRDALLRREPAHWHGRSAHAHLLLLRFQHVLPGSRLLGRPAHPGVGVDGDAAVEVLQIHLRCGDHHGLHERGAIQLRVVIFFAFLRLQPRLSNCPDGPLLLLQMERDLLGIPRPPQGHRPQVRLDHGAGTVGALAAPRPPSRPDAACEL
mmetsp:Transcript_103031/g.315215  ORF Transcript_103031/g.315215 Transcript_103031/m.315215 type:complete len:504 (+) Transcript_103031:1031-2542(+)